MRLRPTTRRSRLTSEATFCSALGDAAAPHNTSTIVSVATGRPRRTSSNASRVTALPTGSGAGVGSSPTKRAKLPARLIRNDGVTGCKAPAICASMTASAARAAAIVAFRLEQPARRCQASASAAVTESGWQPQPRQRPGLAQPRNRRASRLEECGIT
jgi:hypothetical protein